MKKLIFMLLLLFGNLAQADGQFYLLAKPGVLGSASQSGQTGLGVHLRFDTLEGELPDDIESLSLRRKDLSSGITVELLPAQPGQTWNPGEMMTQADIEAMYRESGQQQRLMQTLTMLKNIELAENRDFEPNQFASVLLNRLNDPLNNYWNFLASRQNFNIARARKRAYLDRSVNPATNYEYTLFAIQLDTAAEVVLGRATVNTGNKHQLLPVQDLKQLVSSCDSSQDHYTIKLDWLAPGNSVTDQASNIIQLAGYELYRTTQNLAANIETPPFKDLASDAATLVHDGRGEIVFDGLQRVNSQLLMLDGDGDPGSFEFLEAPNSLRVAGLVPGDRRVYYVVGRDFSGHYGKTAAVIVQVPNRLSPVAPWDFTAAYRQGASAGIRIGWDQVSLDNFQAKYPDRVVCNPAQAANTGLLEYVPSGRACIAPAIARLDVTGYRLYRFDDAVQARGFKDSDGDGVSDYDEYPSNMQCDSDQQPPGADNYKVDISSSVLHAGDRNRLSFLDDGAQLVEGEFYHYRLSSFTADGKFSSPSGPFRVLYPDVTPPAPPTFDIARPFSGSCEGKECDTDEVVTDGSFGTGDVTLTISTDDGSCSEYYEDIAGQQKLIATSCGTDTPGVLTIVFEDGLVCGSVIARDSSNNRSEAVTIPCNIVANPEPPSPPQIISLDALIESLDFSWRSPLQPTSATLIEISSDVGAEDTRIISFPANNQQPGFEFSDSAVVHTLVGARDQWCVRAMAVGLAAGNQAALHSPWSGMLCRTRRENGLNETEYLPWPTIRPLSAGASLTVELAADYASDLQGEDPENLPILLKQGTFTNLFRAADAGGTEICIGYLQVVDPLNSNKHHILTQDFICRNAGKNIINGETEDMPFMVYRQARSPSGDTGSWVQVSPLLESIYWEKGYDKGLQVINTLSDPYFSMYRHEYVEERDAAPWYLGFVDRYPYILGYQYRYQTVVFTTPQHAIKSWHLSDWILTTGPVNE